MSSQGVEELTMGLKEYRAPCWNLFLRALTLLAIALLAGTGCQQGNPPGSGSESFGTAADQKKAVAALPPASAGKVYIVPRKIQEDRNTVHWQWTINGDRNWAATRADWQLVELIGSYPIDDTGHTGGSNAYEYDLIISAVDIPAGNIDLRYRFSVKQMGSQLPSLTDPGTAGPNKSGDTVRRDVKKVAVNQATKALLTVGKEFPLPFDQAVLEVTGEEASGKPFRDIFRCKVFK
jgi:hypothetical protein